MPAPEFKTSAEEAQALIADLYEAFAGAAFSVRNGLLRQGVNRAQAAINRFEEAEKRWTTEGEERLYGTKPK